MTDAVIVDAVRTPLGKRGGGLAGVHPADLSALVLRSLVERTGLDPALVDDVIWGCVGQVGEQSFDIARTAVLSAGWPEHVPGVTIDRQCGSSQQAVHFAAAGVIAGQYDVVVAGGVESMSRVPLGASVTAGGSPLGSDYVRRYGPSFPNQGIGAEMIVERWGLSRVALDELSLMSHARAAAAADSGAFDAEIVPVTVPVTGPVAVPVTGPVTRPVTGPASERVARPDDTGAHPGDDPEASATVVRADEGIRRGGTIERLAALPPAFRENGSVTAANSSQITDGAAALLITSGEIARDLGLTPIARVHTAVVTGAPPMPMLTGPIPATEKALRRGGLTLADIGAFEVNEAFAAVPLAWLAETGADPALVNPLGGAIALGHPLGASGARLMTTLVHHMRAQGIRYGLQTMCEGGGQANATILELV